MSKTQKMFDDNEAGERYLYSRLIPHLEQIESEHKRGKSYKKIAEQFDLPQTKFYRALQRAKLAVKKDPDRIRVFEPECTESMNRSYKNPSSTQNVEKRTDDTTDSKKPVIEDGCEPKNNDSKSNQKKSFNRDELMKKIKPSAFKHRFNLDLKHT